MNKDFNDVTFAAEFLHTVQPFNALAGEDLQWLARRLEVNYYPQDSAIFASRPSPGLAIIRKGAARLLDLPPEVLDTTARVILLTDHRKHPDWVKFDNVNIRHRFGKRVSVQSISPVPPMEFSTLKPVLDLRQRQPGINLRCDRFIGLTQKER